MLTNIWVFNFDFGQPRPLQRMGGVCHLGQSSKNFFMGTSPYPIALLRSSHHTSNIRFSLKVQTHITSSPPPTRSTVVFNSAFNVFNGWTQQSKYFAMNYSNQTTCLKHIFMYFDVVAINIFAFHSTIKNSALILSIYECSAWEHHSKFAFYLSLSDYNVWDSQWEY